MLSIHTGEQINNSILNPSERSQTRQRLRYISQNDRLPLLSLYACFTGSCKKFSLLRRSMILDQRFLVSTNPESGFSLLSLERSSLAVFAGVQDVVDLAFHVSIKWGTALLVHHFVVRQRLIESQPLVDFSSDYSVYARSLPTLSPVCFSLALALAPVEFRRHEFLGGSGGMPTTGKFVKLDSLKCNSPRSLDRNWVTGKVFQGV